MPEKNGTNSGYLIDFWEITITCITAKLLIILKAIIK